MALYIDGKSYKDNSSRDKQLEAVKNLPSPLPDVRKDFDKKVYNVQPQGDNFLINKKDGKSDFDGKIMGKNEVVFTERTKWSDEVYRVDQGDVAFTTGKRIGTPDVQDCVALIIQDKDTKKTALAHIKHPANQRLIRNILSYMPSGEKEVIMIGARHGVDGSRIGNSSTQNVTNILSILLEYEYDAFINKSYVLDSSYIYDTAGSFTQACYDLNTAFGDIIVDTSNLTISCGYPGKSLPREKNGIECSSFSCDLDRFSTLNSKEDIDKYNGDMKDIRWNSIKPSKLVTGITAEAVHKGVIHEV